MYSPSWMTGVGGRRSWAGACCNSAPVLAVPGRAVALPPPEGRANPARQRSTNPTPSAPSSASQTTREPGRLVATLALVPAAPATRLPTAHLPGAARSVHGGLARHPGQLGGRRFHAGLDGLAGRHVQVHGVRDGPSAARRAGPQSPGRSSTFVPFKDFLRLFFLRGRNTTAILNLGNTAGSAAGSPPEERPE